jgi:uncharacterized membrane protein YcgQ (UPF0703/DUF1980 family)
MSLAAFSKLVNASIKADWVFQLCQYHQHVLEFERIYKKMASILFTAASLIFFSNATLNSRLPIASPCGTTFLTLMGSENLFYILNRHWVLFIVALTKAIRFCGIFSSSMAAYRRRLPILSYAALKPIKRWYMCLYHVHCIFQVFDVQWRSGLL